jgi:hypothetical protein
MSSAPTHRLAAIGTLCRRPAAVLIPLAPLVLLVFAAASSIAMVRGRLRVRAASSGDLASESLQLEPVAVVTARPSRGFASVSPTPRRLLGGAAALMGGILLAASFAGGTYAFLNAQATTPAVTVSSGNLAVAVQYGSGTAGATAAIPTAAWSNMLPGDFVGQQFTITNTGSANAAMTARLSAMTAWDIRLAAGACPATQLTSAPLTTAAASYGTLPTNTNAVICVQATLPAGTAASTEATSVPFTIAIDAKQVAP